MLQVRIFHNRYDSIFCSDYLNVNGGVGKSECVAECEAVV